MKNGKYLDSLSSDKKSRILKNIASHYGISVADAEDEVRDEDAEMLYEYIANDKSLRMEVYNDMERGKMAKGGNMTDKLDKVREKVNNFLNPLGYSARVEKSIGDVLYIIEPSTQKVGNKRKDFFDGMQILAFQDGSFEVSEYMAGANEDELHIYKETNSLNTALKELIKGNKRKPIKKYAKGGMTEHGLEIGDKITGRGHGDKIEGYNKEMRETFTTDLDKGKRSSIRYAKGGLMENEYKKGVVLVKSAKATNNNDVWEILNEKWKKYKIVNSRKFDLETPYSRGWIDEGVSINVFLLKDTTTNKFYWDSDYVKAKKNQMAKGGLLTNFNYSIGGL